MVQFSSVRKRSKNHISSAKWPKNHISSGFFWDTNLVIMIFARPCPNLEFSQKMCWFSKLCIFPGFLVLRCSKARKCSEFVPNFVSFGAFYYEKWLTFRKCSEMVPNFTPCGAFNLEKKWLLVLNWKMF